MKILCRFIFLQFLMKRDVTTCQVRDKVKIVLVQVLKVYGEV